MVVVMATWASRLIDDIKPLCSAWTWFRQVWAPNLRHKLKPNSTSPIDRTHFITHRSEREISNTVVIQ